MFKFHHDISNGSLGEISCVSNAEGSLASMKSPNEGYDVARSL